MAYGSESDDSGNRPEGQGMAAPSVAALSETKISIPKDKKNPQKRYICTVVGCTASFSRPWRLEAHLSVHCGETPFMCDQEGCTKGYTSQNHLTRHKKNAHSGGLTPSKLYKCPFDGCTLLLKTNQNLKKHYKRAHETKRECPVCGQKFAKSLQMKYHMQFHTGEFLHRCEPCCLNFSRKTEYNRHMKRHNIFACPYPNCLLGFTVWSAVRKHLKSHKPRFICFYCRKQSLHKGTFRQHVLTHLHDTPKRVNILKAFSCFHCSRTLFGKKSLRRHIKNLHLNKTKKKRRAEPKKPRKPRKDKGLPKAPQIAISSQLTGVVCSRELTTALVNSYEPILETPEQIIEAIQQTLLQ